MLSILYVGESIGSISQLNSHENIVLIACSNQQEAANALLNGPLPDAILCEHLLSDGNGIEWHKQLRENPAYDKISFILLVHEFSEELFKTAFLNRIDDFFVFPLPPVEGLFDRLMFLKYYRHIKPASQPEPSSEDVFQMPASKRIFDLVVACSVLLILAPILLLTTIVIRIGSPGKIFYTSKRFGRGRLFDIYTLRSSSEEYKNLTGAKTHIAASQKRSAIDFSIPCPNCSALPQGISCSPLLHNDNNEICEYWYLQQKHSISTAETRSINFSKSSGYTEIGDFLRKTGLDQWPQLINVIKGDMSIVGNDPLALYEVEHLMNDALAKRFLAPVGIISLWQVEGRSPDGTRSEIERHLFDNAYADHFARYNYSIWYDLRLILRRIR